MQKNTILKQMGIQTWVSRQEKPEVVAISAKPEKVTTGQTWEELQNAIRHCIACGLCKARTHTVFGVGNPQADVMFIGEAPGANEDLQGEPFVGRAGKLLDSMLAAIDMDRTQVFIANILKCRPPQNRDPKPEEVATCTPFLNRQIELVRPKLLVALGRIAAQYLLTTNLPLTRLRMSQHDYGEQKIPLITTYHPAYLLRTPRDKAKAYEDLLKIKQFVNSSSAKNTDSQ